MADQKDDGEAVLKRLGEDARPEVRRTSTTRSSSAAPKAREAAGVLERLAVPADPGGQGRRPPTSRCRSWSAASCTPASPPSSRRSATTRARGRERRARPRLPRPGHRRRAQGARRPSARAQFASHRPRRPRRPRGAVRRVPARAAGRAVARRRPRRRRRGHRRHHRATPGNYVVTNIDAKLQAVAEKALRRRRSRRRGPARTATAPATTRPTPARSSCMDVETGKVLAMASYPTYDPNVWVGGVTKKELRRALPTRRRARRSSRAPSAGQYAPGSTFKVVSTRRGGRGRRQPFNGSYDCPRELSRSATDKQQLRVRGLRHDQHADAPSRCPATRSSTSSRYDAWVRRRRPTPMPAAPTTRSSRPPSGSGFGSPPDRPAVRGRRPDRRPRVPAEAVGADEGRPVQAVGPARGQGTRRACQLRRSSPENCVDGYQSRGGDAANFAIGQGDTLRRRSSWRGPTRRSPTAARCCSRRSPAPSSRPAARSSRSSSRRPTASCRVRRRGIELPAALARGVPPRHRPSRRSPASRSQVPVAAKTGTAEVSTARPTRRGSPASRRRTTRSTPSS